jgi:Mg2+ and Co2+ transporter CorA
MQPSDRERDVARRAERPARLDELAEQEHGIGRFRALFCDGEVVRAIDPDAAATHMQRGTPALGDASELVWIDIVRPTAEDGTLLRDVLHFHPLAVEDCLQGKQMPKLERYPGYFFLIVYAARINPERNRPAFYELHCFVGPNYLVTVRHESVREVRELMARGGRRRRTIRRWVTWRTAFWTRIVDSYFPMVDHFSDTGGGHGDGGV